MHKPSDLSLVFLALCFFARYAFSLDPFYPPEVWEKYQRQILQERLHEKPLWNRPIPGESTIVRLQTLNLPEFAVKDVHPLEALDQWRQACASAGVEVSIYLDTRVQRNHLSISHSAKGENAIRNLNYLLNLSMVGLSLAGEHLLVGHRNEQPEPQRVTYRLWILTEGVPDLLALKTQTTNPVGWLAAEAALSKAGAAFPSGTYADYNPALKALVVVNTGVTLDALGSWIKETESAVLIAQWKDKPVQAREGYTLAVRAFPLRKDESSKLHQRLKSSKDRLTPFATNSANWLDLLGIENPVGSAAWLDTKSSLIWVRNRPDQLEAFAKMLDVARENLRNTTSE